MSSNSPKDKRKDRLAGQLRANLARRKAQARAKRAGEPDTRPHGPGSSEGETSSETGDGGVPQGPDPDRSTIE
ncbi:hypothetical protein [Oricola sp.]|uniref:hypothetical protein n=1 Tax=Oricola sp. TaxID=1979950 RepID=UPI003BAD8B06